MHHTSTANGNPRLTAWSHVRSFAVPTSMIESATARRVTGDWAGACAAARVDVDLDLRAAGRAHGEHLVARVRDDLRHLAPDLLRWHFPRIAPEGLLRPGLTATLARYGPGGVRLVARTPPSRAGAGQRISLALWDPEHPRDGVGQHPHPRPDRRFRFDLHRHLWDVRRSGELRERAGDGLVPDALAVDPDAAEVLALVDGAAVDRWADEAALALRADGADGADRAGAGRVLVRLTARHRLVLRVDGPEPRLTGASRRDRGRRLPVLPDAATLLPPDVELLRAGLIEPDRLHPLVAAALRPGHGLPAASPGPDAPRGSRTVRCRGATHRIGVVDGVLVALDHDPVELRREELLVALGGPGLPCLRAIDDVHRHPESLVDVRALLGHGDAAGALDVVEGLLGPEAVLRGGILRDELEAAALGRIAHGVFRAGLAEPGTRRAYRRPHGWVTRDWSWDIRRGVEPRSRRRS
ncbi:hypothetical protein [Actinosynnema mirum]|uniref:Uncharacterized protein n=1 Tax=Actinosynnema mirum (strain ATCC 29888 / DSM 43827 / JCM 3225 / NBRC 14064 / NCIMB 13271 / NRRL B-12336 / IMRU 3971 / 101) TaxID=446462 RepID=C6W9L0_ACTMD|nr:hypothetical protein [Actinosynnema mirum]ACU37227.1 hypothetical protein Amir_3322 [Actinosynnema mirum DSM 43827]